ncbi:MAG: hypothetical protein LBO07_01810 [Coriobacteriales bacterium]|jgi:hypothetical protein|nr:hypothetical protein [Coriobacteriales bacterium]
MLKRIILIAGGALLLVAALYLAMLLDTNSLMRYMRSVFNGEVPLEETAGRPEDMYNPLFYFDDPQVTFELRRVFVLHNFSDGYVWIRYSRVIQSPEFDPTSENPDYDLLSSTGSTPSLWRIHKDEDGWHIVDIEERP